MTRAKADFATAILAGANVTMGLSYHLDVLSSIHFGAAVVMVLVLWISLAHHSNEP